MCRFISDLNLASWIHKTSSLLFLNHVDADNSQFRLALLSNDGSTSERDSHQEEIKSEATADIKRSHNLTSSQKRALIVKRLIPLVISLMILGGAVALRFLIPLPSSHETSSFGNDTLTANTSYNNLTTNLVTWTTRDHLLSQLSLGPPVSISFSWCWMEPKWTRRDTNRECLTLFIA